MWVYKFNFILYTLSGWCYLYVEVSQGGAAKKGLLTVIFGYEVWVWGPLISLFFLTIIFLLMIFSKQKVRGMNGLH